MPAGMLDRPQEFSCHQRRKAYHQWSWVQKTNLVCLCQTYSIAPVYHKYTSIGEQEGLPLETQISIHDAQKDPHVLSAPARDDIPIRHPTNSKLVSNVFVNQDQSRPHATLNSEEARTRLLARLEFEKKQACLLGHADENPILRADSVTTALRGPALMSSSNAPSVKIDIYSIVPSKTDLSLSRRESTSTTCDTGQRHNDPAFSSSIISEEAVTQEARLRSRAQLRVRLAAEKRLVRGD